MAEDSVALADAKSTGRLRQVSVHRFRAGVEGHYLGINGTEGWNQASWAYQCVNTYGEFLQEAHLEQVTGNALTLDYTRYGKFIKNAPGNSPRAGDAVIFQGGRYDAVNGHIGLALHDSDERRMHVLWQNDPDFSPEHAVYTNYDNCLGWWRIDWPRHGVELIY